MASKEFEYALDRIEILSVRSAQKHADAVAAHEAATLEQVRIADLEEKLRQAIVCREQAESITVRRDQQNSQLGKEAREAEKRLENLYWAAKALFPLRPATRSETRKNRSKLAALLSELSVRVEIQF